MAARRLGRLAAIAATQLLLAGGLPLCAAEPRERPDTPPALVGAVQGEGFLRQKGSSGVADVESAVGGRVLGYEFGRHRDHWAEYRLAASAEVVPGVPEEVFGRLDPKRPAYGFTWAGPGQYNTQNAVLLNLTHPAQSRLLRAPLARQAGGLAGWASASRPRLPRPTTRATGRRWR